jgi:hypothetical protein
MSTLIVGHSQAKHFEEYIDIDNAVCLWYSGFRTEQIWPEIFDMVPSFDIVVLHVGANDLSDGDSPESVLSSFEDLAENIWSVNPG